MRFRISVHEPEGKEGWTLVETNIPQFGIREIVRNLRDAGYEDEAILIEAI